VECPAWLDWVHGGLQFQAVHHLFPRIPRHNLRRAQKLVIEFCEEVEIPYAVFGFVDGNRKVLGRLEEVARMASMLGAAQGELARDMCSPGH
jgi:sphingolipid 8-(E)-desaturase